MDDKLLFVDEFNHLLCEFAKLMKANGKSDDEIVAFFDSEKGKEVGLDLANEMIKGLTESLEQYLAEDAVSDKADLEHYKNHIESLWGVGLQWMRNLYSKCIDICQSYHAYVNASEIHSDKHHVGEALWHLHARATLVYAEVICLLENGYPDGAYMHYRTLHELWAVATFINSEPNDVAKAFLDSSNNSTNSADKHYEWAKLSVRFNNDTYKTINISQIAGIAHELLQQSSNKGVSKNHLKRVYTFPNLLIHPSVKGVLGRTSENYGNSITVGRVDTGLVVPAINSSMMYFNITQLHLAFAPCLISSIGIGILNEIIGKKLIPAFKEAEKRQKEAQSE